jgi:hypothetical protein
LPNAACNGGVAQISGSHALQVVDAGQGTFRGFSTISAQGIAALIQVADCDSDAFPVGCAPAAETFGHTVLWQQTENTLRAGAAVVLLDAGTDPQFDPIACQLTCSTGPRYSTQPGSLVGPLTRICPSPHRSHRRPVFRAGLAGICQTR